MKYCVYVGVLAVTLLGLSVVRGQAPYAPGANGPMLGQPMPGPAANNATLVDPYRGIPTDAPAPNGAQRQAGTPPQEGVNDFLTYLRYGGCCGPLGSHGPINTEVVIRSGISVPMGGSIPGRALGPGFMLTGAGRSLFFNPSQDLAWTVEAGLSSVWYNADQGIRGNLLNVVRPVFAQGGNTQLTTLPGGQGDPITDTIGVLPLTTSSLHQFFVHLSTGHEVYLWGHADCADAESKWRIGYDVGGRWGTAKLVFNETLRGIPLDPATRALVAQTNPGVLPVPGPIPFRHRTDTVGGVFLSLHTDWELPCKSCILYAGVRTEASYIWAQLLQSQNDTNLLSVNVLFNVGCRF